MLIMAWLGWTFASVLLVCAVAEGLGLLGARRRVRTLNQTVRAQGAALISAWGLFAPPLLAAYVGDTAEAQPDLTDDEPDLHSGLFPINDRVSEELDPWEI